MRIGVMLRDYARRDGGIRGYTRSVLPPLLELGTAHRFCLIYQDPRLLGTWRGYSCVEEVAAPFPGAAAWEQVAVPWVAWRRRLDLVFDPAGSVPLLTGARTAYVLHGVQRSVRLYARRADAVITVANTVRDEAMRHLGVREDRAFTVRNGVDARRFRRVEDAAELERVRAKHDLPARFILWLGGSKSGRTLDALLGAFSLVALGHPHKLVIAGGSRLGATGRGTPVRTLGLRRRVHLTGWIDPLDLPAVYSMAEMLVMPSLRDGFGLQLAEAMACGCPIVACNTGAAPEITAGAALLVDPTDVRALGAAMRRLVEDRELRDALVARGLGRSRDFSWETCARGLLQVFESFAASGRLPAQTSVCEPHTTSASRIAR